MTERPHRPPPLRKPKLAIVHPVPAIGDRLERLMEPHADVLPVARLAPTGLEVLLNLGPDVALIGGRFADETSALSLLRSALAVDPSLRIALVLTRSSVFAAEKAIEAGAVGTVDVSLDDAEVRRGICQLLAGRSYVPPAIFRALAPPLVLDNVRFDHRELAVLDALASGPFSTGSLADQLGLSTRQVQTTLTTLRLSLGVGSIAELVVLAGQVSSSASASAMSAAEL